MSHQTVPAGNGLQWLVSAVNLILKNPVPFLLMALVVGAIAIVPVLGGLALAVLGPALNGGIMYAAREQEAGRSADFQHLFQAFREDGKIGKMILLCLPGIAAGIVIVILAVVFLGGALLSAGVIGSSGGSSSSALGAGFGVSMVLFVLIALALGLASYALTFFAVPRVMLDSVDAWSAMKESLQACLANLGAMVVYILILGAAFVVASVVLSIIPFLGQLVVMVALVPVAAVSSYLAWREVYRAQITQEVPPAVPPAPPSVEV